MNRDLGHFDDKDLGRERLSSRWMYPSEPEMLRPMRVNIAGDTLQIDMRSARVTVRLNSEEGVAFDMEPGSALQGVVFKCVYLTWSAQGARPLLINYGVGGLHYTAARRFDGALTVITPGAMVRQSNRDFIPDPDTFIVDSLAVTPKTGIQGIIIHSVRMEVEPDANGSFASMEMYFKNDGTAFEDSDIDGNLTLIAALPDTVLCPLAARAIGVQSMKNVNHISRYQLPIIIETPIIDAGLAIGIIIGSYGIAPPGDYQPRYFWEMNYELL